MGTSKDIAELRRRLFRGSDFDTAETFYASVVSVDEAARTCVVEAEEVQYDDVLLHAVADSEQRGFCFIPAPGSTVLVSRIGGSNELYVSMFAEVDRVLLTIEDKMSAAIDAEGLTLEVGETKIEASAEGVKVAAKDTKLEATANGLELSRSGAGLLKTLTDLCDAILQLTVSTAVGPSSVPVNAAAFMSIKQELNKYLKG